MTNEIVRIAVDIGGTFTDVALEQRSELSHFTTAKTPTTPANPVEGAITAVRLALEKAHVAPSASNLKRYRLQNNLQGEIYKSADNFRFTIFTPRGKNRKSKISKEKNRSLKNAL